MEFSSGDYMGCGEFTGYDLGWGDEVGSGQSDRFGSALCDGHLLLGGQAAILYERVDCSGIRPDSYAATQYALVPLTEEGNIVFSSDVAIEIYSPSSIEELDVEPLLALVPVTEYGAFTFNLTDLEGESDLAYFLRLSQNPSARTRATSILITGIDQERQFFSRTYELDDLGGALVILP